MVYAIHKVILYEGFNLLNDSFSYLIQTPELWEVVPATTTLWLLTPTDAVLLCGLVSPFGTMSAAVSLNASGRFLRSHPHVSCPTVLLADEERWDAVCATVSSSKKIWNNCRRPSYGPLSAWATIKKVFPVRSVPSVVQDHCWIDRLSGSAHSQTWLKNVDSHPFIDFKLIL